MPIDCSCDVIPREVFRKAVEARVDAVREAKTLNAAAGVIFRETHPSKQNVDGSDKRRCNTCVGHIREMIVEMGLRPQSELDAQKSDLPKAKAACGSCSAGCKIPAFDLSAR